MTSRHLFTASLVWLLGSQATLGLDLREAIDPHARQLTDHGTAVGLVVGVIRGGETQVIGYGEVKRGSGVLPDGDTVYEIGSISKAFTGVLLADMVERGLVKLDDPLQTYLPAGVKAPVKDDQPITLLGLATHTSGLPRMPDNFRSADRRNPYADYSAKQMFDFLNGHGLRRPPGQYEYSNYAMGLLGYVLARKADSDYESLLASRIAQPLDMGDTRVALTDDMRRRLATPYDAMGRPSSNWDIPTLAGAGGIRSTVNDMLKFLAANLAKDDKPLSRACRLAQVKRNTMKSGQGMGLGWHIARDGVTRWHNGMTGGYHTWASVVPDRGVGVVVLSNTATPTISRFGEKMTRIALGINVPLPKARKAIDLPADVLKGYIGVYRFTPQFTITVTFEGGKLMAQGSRQRKLQLFAESKTAFFYRAVDAQITFTVDADGTATRLVLHQGGRDQPGERLK